VGWFFALPIAVRLILLFVVGLFLGSLINWAIYQVCWNQRSISPWSAADPKAPPRHWSDRLPVIGWLGLQREAELHGTFFWIRPLMIEMACAMGLSWLYLWETVDKGLHAWNDAGLVGAIATPPPAVMHAQFLSHAILFAFLIAATFIDFDEKTIPDSITIPGTLIGLLLAGLLPDSLLADFGRLAAKFVPISLRMSLEWPEWLNGPYGLLLGILCLVGWWYALLPKLFYFRGGIGKGLRLLFAKMFRYRESLYLTLMLLITSAYTAAVWAWGSPAKWPALLSALVGMAFGGAVIWGFRVVAGAVLGQEAMGFGDVTLMAMIGAYVGWQPILLVFFIAPFAGLVIAVAQWVITRKHEIAYGPYLALGTVVLILNWPWWWLRANRYFDLGLFIPVILVGCLVLMAIMLGAWMWFKRRFLR